MNREISFSYADGDIGVDTESKGKGVKYPRLGRGRGGARGGPRDACHRFFSHEYHFGSFISYIDVKVSEETKNICYPRRRREGGAEGAGTYLRWCESGLSVPSAQCKGVCVWVCVYVEENDPRKGIKLIIFFTAGQTIRA